MAFLFYERFGTLPYAGGTFEQPHDLLMEMAYVQNVVAAAKNAEIAAQGR
jgi:hypothetical protein